MWEFLIGKTIVHIVHLERKSVRRCHGKLPHQWFKTGASSQMFWFWKEWGTSYNLPVVTFKIMSSPKELPPSGWLLALKRGSKLVIEKTGIILNNDKLIIISNGSLLAPWFGPITLSMYPNFLSNNKHWLLRLNSSQAYLHKAQENEPLPLYHSQIPSRRGAHQQNRTHNIC